MPGQAFVIVAGTPHFRQNRQLRTPACNSVKSCLNFCQVPVYITKRDIKLNSCYLQIFSIISPQQNNVLPLFKF